MEAFIMKRLVEYKNKNKNLSKIEFGIFTNNEIVQQSHVKVYNNNIYDDNKCPADHGLMDSKMGPMDNSKCKVCDQDRKNCMGHFGNINMSNYLFPLQYLKDIVKILKCICKSCGHVLLPDKELKSYDKKLRKADMDYIAKKHVRQEIMKLSMKVRVCRFCHSPNGNVKKVKSLSMIYHKKCATKESLAKYKERFSHLSDDLRSLTNDSIELLRPNFVFNLFKLVPRKHYKYLGVGCGMNLIDLIFKHVAVPPNCIRPSSLTNDINQSREDDVTISLRTLLGELPMAAAHNEYANMIRPGSGNLRIKDNIYVRGIQQRLAGKKGRFRSNLMGKRTNFTGRTVISPDPYLRIDQISIPEFCALRLTFTEMVTSFNIDHLRTLIANGPFKHPGAVAYAEMPANESLEAMGQMKLLNPNQAWKSLRSKAVREHIMRTMKIGDLIERHIDNDDRVLFNRQPSLHRLSFQSFCIVVKKERTLSFNPCCCNPFNADFDGDEMNIHFTQTYESKAESQELLSSTMNTCSPNRGEPLTAPLQDILTAAYLMTSKDTFLTEMDFRLLASKIFKDLDRNQRIVMPRPVIIRPVKMYTGKQLMSLVISPYRQWSRASGQYVATARVNLIAENKVYKSGQELTSDDSYVVVHNSDLMTGQLDKALLGGGSKASLFYRLLRDVGEKASCSSMERLCKVALTELKNRGFSIGIQDVTPINGLTTLKASLIASNFAACERYIAEYATNTLQCDPGCSIEDTLESRLSSTLSNIRDEGGRACRERLSQRNAALIMALCGSKGSLINVSQMIFCVGQQIIANSRIPTVKGTGRTLLYSSKNCLNPKSKGFVENSFYSGLNPAEFIFHAMSGREGLIDTAVKTAETGYMQRRLVKILEDLTIMKDNTVRDFSGKLVQYKYGYDGFDPAKMESSESPCNFVHEFYHAAQDNRFNEAELPDLDATLVALEELLTPLSDQFDMMKKSLRDTVCLHFTSQVGIMYRVSKSQLSVFVNNCYRKFNRAFIEPATAVGVICGQCIGEPATQMTLKTFHFAGLASMNITQGIPRMQEIINGSAVIKTPVVSIYPIDDTSPESAKYIQMKVQPVYIRDLVTSSHITFSSLYKVFDLDLSPTKVQEMTISQDQLLAAVSKVNIKSVDIRVVYKVGQRICIRALSDTDFNCQMVLRVLEKVQITGVKNVKRTIIQRNDTNKHTVFMEGGGLIAALQVYGVDTNKTISNNIMEISQVFGIEAAKNAIMNEFTAVMASHSLVIDRRHTLLLADTMCYMGQVLGFQRSGMAKSKNSVLCLASFEKTIDHLVEASYHNIKDDISGVSDCILLGKTIPIGTGLTTILMDNSAQPRRGLKRKFLE